MEGSSIVIDTRSYLRGRASGYRNNCLIDTLRQSLQLVAKVAWVRNQLRRQFADGPAIVTEENFLTLQHHWRAIIELLFEADESGKPKASSDIFTIVCVDLTYRDNGEVVGQGPFKLHIAREETIHFVPLIRQHRRIHR